MESLLEFLLKSTVVGAYLVQNWKFRYVNPALARIFGYQPEEIIYRLGPLDLTHPDDREMVGRNIRSCIEGRVVHVHSVFRGLCKDGSTIYCELYGSCTEYGGKLAVVGTLVDITERKQAEEALRESEERYRTLAESSLTGIFIHRDGRYVFVNKQFARMHGYRPEELIGRDYLELIHLEDRDVARQRTARRIRGEILPEQHEIRKITKDGKIFWCSMMAVPIQHKDKPAVMGNAIDITDRKELEEKLRMSLKGLREVLEATIYAFASAVEKRDPFSCLCR